MHAIAVLCICTGVARRKRPSYDSNNPLSVLAEVLLASSPARRLRHSHVGYGPSVMKDSSSTTITRRSAQSSTLIAQKPSPLKVALTLEDGKNRELQAAISNACKDLPSGALEFVEIPLIHSVPGKDLAALEFILEKFALSDEREDSLPFDIVMLTSPESARIFVEGWQRLPEEMRIKQPPAMVCICQRTAAVLQAAGLEPSFQPSVASEKTLAAELPHCFGRRVLYLTSRTSPNARSIITYLTMEGFNVVPLEVYSTERVTVSSLPNPGPPHHMAKNRLGRLYDPSAEYSLYDMGQGMVWRNHPRQDGYWLENLTTRVKHFVFNQTANYDGEWPPDTKCIVLLSPEAARMFIQAWMKAATVHDIVPDLLVLGRGTAAVLEASGFVPWFQPSQHDLDCFLREIPMVGLHNEAIIIFSREEHENGMADFVYKNLTLRYYGPESRAPPNGRQAPDLVVEQHQWIEEQWENLGEAELNDWTLKKNQHMPNGAPKIIMHRFDEMWHWKDGIAGRTWDVKFRFDVNRALVVGRAIEYQAKMDQGDWHSLELGIARMVEVFEANYYKHYKPEDWGFDDPSPNAPNESWHPWGDWIPGCKVKVNSFNWSEGYTGFWSRQAVGDRVCIPVDAKNSKGEVIALRGECGYILELTDHDVLISFPKSERWLPRTKIMPLDFEAWDIRVGDMVAIDLEGVWTTDLPEFKPPMWSIDIETATHPVKDRNDMFGKVLSIDSKAKTCRIESRLISKDVDWPIAQVMKVHQDYGPLSGSLSITISDWVPREDIFSIVRRALAQDILDYTDGVEGPTDDSGFGFSENRLYLEIEAGPTTHSLTEVRRLSRRTKNVWNKWANNALSFRRSRERWQSKEVGEYIEGEYDWGEGDEYSQLQRDRLVLVNQWAGENVTGDETLDQFYVDPNEGALPSWEDVDVVTFASAKLVRLWAEFTNARPIAVCLGQEARLAALVAGWPLDRTFIAPTHIAGWADSVKEAIQGAPAPTTRPIRYIAAHKPIGDQGLQYASRHM